VTAADRSGSAGSDAFETRAVHAGQPPDPVTGAVVTPISLATTFAQSEVGGHPPFEYARTGNPTRAAYEACVASLEGAGFGFAFASGMAAEDAVIRLLDPGAHVIVGNDAYGGTYRLLARVHEPAGFVSLSTCDVRDASAVDRAWREETRLVWIETPTNPLLRVVDIEAVARVAHERGALVVVDNTFATPYLQQPLALGADVVVHSVTKYLGGHSDVVGGFVALDDAALSERLAFLQNAIGAVPSPFDCYLALRGVKTLAVRMDRHCANARAIAERLAQHAGVAEVLWPGFAESPDHDVAKRQMRDFGGMVSFRCRGGEAAALRVAAATKLFTLAESLGAVESLIEHPGRMTHASVAGSELEVPADLLRLSIGIEDVEDLWSDLEAALDAAR
jgi:cystathionine gamma-synthase